MRRRGEEAISVSFGGRFSDAMSSAKWLRELQGIRQRSWQAESEGSRLQQLGPLPRPRVQLWRAMVASRGPGWPPAQHCPQPPSVQGRIVIIL
jgi:hypothetical protein